MANKAKDKQGEKDADRLRLTKMVQDLPLAGVNLKTGEIGLRELSEKVRDSDSYGTPLSKGAISAGVKKVKDAPLLKKLGSPTDRKKLDEKATQAAREAGAEERREARGMKKGGAVKKKSVSSASKRADGIAMRGKTRGRMV